MYKFTGRLSRFVNFPILLITLIWLAAVATRFARNGEVYGLNYYVFQPDGSLYMAQALHYLGDSWEAASRAVTKFYFESSFASPSEVTIPESVQAVLNSRPLYSVLSLPFVYLIGPIGILVIPLMAYYISGLLILKVAQLKGNPILGVLTFALLSFSTTFNRWLISNLTDSLLYGLVFLLCYAIATKAQKYILFGLVALILLTRPAGPIIFALFIPFVFKAWSKLTSIVLLSLPVVATIALSTFVPESAGTQTSGTYTLANRISDFPVHLLKVVSVEFGQIFVLDKALMVFLFAVFVAVLLNPKSPWAKAFVYTLVMSLCLGAWNGALGVNFRYELPALVPGAILLLETFKVRMETKPIRSFSISVSKLDHVGNVFS